MGKTPPKSQPDPPTKPERLLSLDAYRGAVMFMLAANGLAIAKVAKVAKATPESDPLLSWLAFQNSHPEWISNFNLAGFALWDMIQPAFMFIVGVAVPYSYAKRKSLGDGNGRIFRHALVRSLILIVLGVFLQSQRGPDTNWIFTNVLSQIGLGYAFLYFVAGRTFRTQFIVAVVVLVATWLIYALYPGPDRWAINANAGWAFDKWFLNLFPRETEWTQHPGGYPTINFVPSFVTMLFGLMCGQLLRKTEVSPGKKLKRFGIAGAVCLTTAVVLDLIGCPIIKKIWSPSWTLFSGAYVIWLLAIFYWIIDLRGWKKWAFPFIIVGLNPLAMYFMSMISKGWVANQWRIHLPKELFQSAGPWQWAIEAALVMSIFWLVIYWMYRRRIFLRI